MKKTAKILNAPPPPPSVPHNAPPSVMTASCGVWTYRLNKRRYRYIIPTMTETIKLIFIGIILGIANVIPGVSGGTIAVVFNIYDRLIQVITLNVKKIVREWKFLLPLVAGMATGIILFSKLITFLFERFPVQTNWFFIGIIAGSLPMICTRFLSAGKTKDDGGGTKRRPSVSAVVCIIVALGVMVAMTFSDVSDTGAAIQTEFSVPLALRLFIGLAFAAVAMIIPGISGSFLMLVVGVYGTVIAAVADMNIPLLIPSALGAVAGLLGGAGIVRLLMQRVPSQTYGAILGLVIGSILVIFPGFGDARTAAASLVCAAAGFALSFFASKEKTAAADEAETEAKPTDS